MLYEIFATKFPKSFDSDHGANPPDTGDNKAERFARQSLQAIDAGVLS
jgi:hypothetical protein